MTILRFPTRERERGLIVSLYLRALKGPKGQFPSLSSHFHCHVQFGEVFQSAEERSSVFWKKYYKSQANALLRVEFLVCRLTADPDCDTYESLTDRDFY